MAEIKRGESLLIPFRNGKSIYDSQCKPRIYKTRKGFEKHFPGHYLGKDGVELVEYAEVVRCKDCKHCRFNSCYREVDRTEALMKEKGMIFAHNAPTYTISNMDNYCSYGERKDND